MVANKLIIELAKVMESVFETAISKSQQNCVNSLLGEFSIQEAKIISFIDTRPDCIMRELSNNFSLPLSTATGVVDKLVKKGIITRERSEKDRRIVLLQLTRKGAEIAQQVEERNLSVSKTLLESLSKKEQEQFVSIFKKIKQSQ
jgi:DNA-binding MarR family transcriptional regulator